MNSKRARVHKRKVRGIHAKITRGGGSQIIRNSRLMILLPSSKGRAKRSLRGFKMQRRN